MENLSQTEMRELGITLRERTKEAERMMAEGELSGCQVVFYQISGGIKITLSDNPTKELIYGYEFLANTAKALFEEQHSDNTNH